MIIHLDADAFFASVEQAADARLRGRPVAVGGERRGVVASASYEARTWGVKAAMPTGQAKRLCPGLVVVPGDFEKYELFSRLIFAYAYDFTPLVEQNSVDEGYFDLGPNREAQPRRVAETIKRAVRQSLKVGVSEGLGSNKLVAQVASKLRKPSALVEVPLGGERVFLEPLPNRWLPGVGPILSGKLDAAGLRTIGQIALVPPEQLMLFAGRLAPELRRFALGEDERRVEPLRPEAKSYSKQETFAEDVTDEVFLAATLRAMTDRLMGRVRGQGKAVRTVSLKIRYNDFQDVLRSESLTEPTELETDLYPVLVRLLKACWQRRVSLRSVSVKLSNIYDAMPMELALDAESARRIARTKVAAVVDGLRAAGTPLMRGHDLWLRRMEGNRKIGKSENRKTSENQSTESRSGADRVSRFPDFPTSRFSVPAPRGRHACVEDYMPINVRSAYSFLDSMILPEKAVEAAAERGLRAAALCDPNLHGVVPFAQEALKAGLKPVIGAELTVEGRRWLCYAEDAGGYARLCRWLTAGTVTAEAFAEDRAGVLAVPAGELPPEIRYLKPEDRRHYGIVQSIRTLTLLQERHPGKRRGTFHWPMPEEIAAMPPEAVRRTREIAERCDFGFEFNRLHFPAYRPEGGASAREFLRQRVMDGFARRYGERRPEVRRQVEEELGIIAEVGYEEYFLVVWDLLRECRQRGIDWITRGSAGDSLVCFCLGISDFCPVRFGLYFQRFLNRDRMALNKLPDIDLDFAHDRKDDVVDLLFAKFGNEHAAVVGGFNTFQSRSAVAEILKVLGVSEGQARRFTERFPWARIGDLETMLRAGKECVDLPLDEEPYGTAVRLASVLDGFPRHAKMHPCGVVLSRVPIRELTPTFVSAKGYPTTHFDMDAVEAVGLVKMDILAQGGLAVFATLAENREIGKSQNRKTRSHKAHDSQDPEFLDFPISRFPDFPGPPWDDPAIWAMIAAGGARGVHHIESPAMISLSRMCQVRTIDDLIAIVSVIRPGAANSLKKVSFSRRCQGLEPVDYAHPSLASVLSSTYGVVAYEEHILQICEVFAGLPGGRADVLRRALVKEKQAVIEEIAVEFAACARALDRSEAEIETVWALVKGFQGYAFCRAHSTAYGLEAYQAAWLKSRHPAEFLAAVLTHGKGFYPRLVYTLEARRLGIGMLGPDINGDGEGYCVERPEGRPCIRVPVTAVKGLSGATLEAWRKARPFASLDDFILRVPAEFSEIQSLIRVGAFDRFGTKRAAQYWHACALAMEAGGGANLGMRMVDLPPEEALADSTRAERLEAEGELLGFTVEEHPLARWPWIDWSGYVPVEKLGGLLDREVEVCGLVVDERLHNQEDGRLMKFVLLADQTGMIECELFADAYERWGAIVARNPVLALRGVVVPFDNRKGWTLQVRSALAPAGTAR